MFHLFGLGHIPALNVFDGSGPRERGPFDLDFPWSSIGK